MASKTQLIPPGFGVFSSVFLRSGVHPPKQQQRFTVTAIDQVPKIKAALTEHLSFLLGIGSEYFVYGQNRWIRDAGSPFHSHFESCPPIAQIRQPTLNDHAAQDAKESKSPFWDSLRSWKDTVGCETVKKCLAGALSGLLTDFVTWSYAGVYREGLGWHLDFWVEHLLSRVAQKACACLEDNAVDAPLPVGPRKWKDMATARLGALRVDELFDIIVDWDATAPAIEDLRHFTTNPATRGYLTHDFASVLQTRLLHPGASTIEIIQLYISIIRSFRVLDPKGVLLERVTRKLRRYLREREDTVKVIVTGLLSDPVSQQGQLSSDSEVLSELAVELNYSSVRDKSADDNEFDWNNMDWLPDPIDAAPDYMKSKNTDVIGSLITLFDTKDVFVKELQNTLADRLLKNKPDFNQEIGVLEHLKLLFGDSALQGCEVMLRDVLDSRKVDSVVRRDRGMQDETGRVLPDDLQLHAKILSRLFWPSMPEQAFTVPQVVLDQQQSYEKGFETLKQSRKLTWLNTVGQVEVELELEDRVFQDGVLPWQAVVIYAFRDADAAAGTETDSGQIRKTVVELATELAMSPTLVRSACIFWVSKRILIELSRDSFAVLERLPDGTNTTMQDDTSRPDAASAVAAAAAAAAQAAKEAEEVERKGKMAMYHQFIVSMLTNQGAMPLPRIAMMLGIVVPGGFPFSNEEVKEFLAGMVKEGVLEVGHGGAYKVAS